MNIPSNYFIYINIAVVLIYLISVFISYKKGLVYSVVKLLFSVLALYVSWRLGSYLAGRITLVNLDLGIISNIINVNAIINQVAWTFICFIVIFLIITIVLPLLKFLSDVPLIGIFNRIGGVIIGLFNATVIVLLLSLILTLPVISNAEEVKNSTFIRYISSFSDDLYKYVIENTDITEQIKNIDLNDLLNKIDVTAIDSADEVVDFIEKISNDSENGEEVKNILNELNLTDLKELPIDQIKEKLENLNLNKLTEYQKNILMQLYLKYTNE